MDAEHSAHLQRILENRRKRGLAPVKTQPSLSPAPTPAAELQHAPKAAAPQQETYKSSTTGASPSPLTKEGSYVPASEKQQPLSHTSSSGMYLPPSQRSEQRTEVVPSEMKMLVEQNRKLQHNQLLQEKKIENLQNELRGGFTNINTTLRSALTPPQPHQQEVHDPRGGARSHGHRTAVELTESHSVMQSQRSYPIPQQLQDGVARPSDTQPMLVPFRAPASTHQRREPLATELPRKPPIAARPFTTSTIDIDSSVTILRSGNWFLKWNKKGSEVHPRFVWLDTEKYILSWGKQRGAPSVLSGHINIEQIQGVTTSQMVEYEDDVARVFFVLTIHTPLRQVFLATEKRDKLDSWYDAINNIAMFYRSHGVLMREEAPGTE